MCTFSRQTTTKQGPDYIANAYIATQGPMPNTIHDFWLMAAQNVQTAASTASSSTTSPHPPPQRNATQTIVMLSDLIENGRPKCAPYFPLRPGARLLVSSGGGGAASSSTGDTLDTPDNGAQQQPPADFSGFRIECVSLERHPPTAAAAAEEAYEVRRLRVQPVRAGRDAADADANGGGAFEARHFWFAQWPDHRAPRDIGVLLALCLHVLEPEPEPEPVAAAAMPIVHCSAGIGRTGCLLAILNGVQQMRRWPTSETAALAKEKEDGEDGEEEQGGKEHEAASAAAGGACVDVLAVVSQLRLQRGGMVQNSEQYELVHRVLCAFERRERRDAAVGEAAAGSGGGGGGETTTAAEMPHAEAADDDGMQERGEANGGGGGGDRAGIGEC